MMIQNKVDPHGMLRLLQILKEASQEEPGIMKYLSTHLDTEARIQSVKTDPAFNSHFNTNRALETIFLQLKGSL